MALDFGENDYTSIVGLSQTVAVKQNLIRQSNPRSTLGSKTGILNNVGLLFAKEGVSTDDSMGSIDDLDASVFSYLSPTGMCFDCGGKGKTFHMHMENIIFSNTATVEEVFKNVGSTKGFLNLLQRKYKEYFDKLFLACPDDIQDELTYGVVDNNSGKVSYCLERVLQNRFNRGEDIQALYSEDICETCQGFRVCEEAIETKINSRHIGEIANMPLTQVKEFLDNVIDQNELSSFGTEMSKTIIRALNLLIDIKLGYLTLYREMPSLSGGELQRVFLHDHMESQLDSLIYVFDEPTSGLHESEKQGIIDSLQALKKQGNTVIVVTHDKRVIQAADNIIDVGEKAGDLGGEIVFQGTYLKFIDCPTSLSAMYLDYDMTKSKKKEYSSEKGSIQLRNACKNNLKNISVDIPSNQIVGIAGVSGSGKSTLISKTLVPLCKEQLKNKNHNVQNISSLGNIKNIIEITQAPIGRKSNSNPVTYLGLWDKIRELYSKQPQAFEGNLKAGDFSFNSKGACPACKGSGIESISIGYDIQFDKVCPECLGTRFNQKTLQVTYKDKNINDVLKMSIDEGIIFFEDSMIDLSTLHMLKKIGMDYMKLGQPTSTLSGGEAQRIKLAKEIGKAKKNNTLYVLDEPSTGLSQYDISKLVYLLNELVASGNSVVVIEHDIDILKACDWLIELGEGSGDKGGNIISQGTPDDLRKNELSMTGRYL